MEPPKVGGHRWLTKVTRKIRKKKERTIEPKNIVEVEDVTMPEDESINPTRVEEEKYVAEEMEVD